MYLSESSMKKWSPVLDHPDLPKIEETYRKQVTAVLLENQEKALQEEKQMLDEAAPANNSFASAGVDRYDPILIGLVRRAMPNLIAYDIAGVQPMTGPTGLIFAMRSLYGNNRTDAGYTEALFNEANTGFSRSSFAANGTTGATSTGSSQVGDNPVDAGYNVREGMTTAFGEALGDSATPSYGQMSFSIDKTTVTAKTRALKAEYTLELAQDLKAVHGLDAETELSNILSHCPYVPLQMVRAVDPDSFQPKIGFKTRYGMIANPYVTTDGTTPDADTFTADRNQYYRLSKVVNLM
jgi:hypothetical protein